MTNPEYRGAGMRKKLPEINFGKVHQVKKSNGRVLVPLVPVGNTHFSASNAFILQKMGYSLSTIKYYCEVARNNSMQAIKDYIFSHGVMIWDKETFHRHPFSHKTKIVPCHQYYINQDN